MSQREIIVTRVYEATRQQLWEAWTTEELIERFFGPEIAPVRPGSATLEVHVGGAFAVEMVGADSGETHAMTAEYIEVDEPVKIALRMPSGGEMHIEFEDLGEGNTLLTWSIRGEMEEEFYRGATLGIHNCADQLRGVLAAQVV